MTRFPYTLLVVDASPEDRELYRHYLLQDVESAYTILEATTVQEGLDLWHQHQPNEAIAVEVMKADAQDYLVKGQLTPETLQQAVKQTIQAIELSTELQCEQDLYQQSQLQLVELSTE